MMSPSRDMTEDDFRTLKAWGVNLLRYQMTRNWSKLDDNQDLAEYDRWQDGRLDHLDAFVLPMAEKYGISVVIDLHVFPGGRNAAKESNRPPDSSGANGIARARPSSGRLRFPQGQKRAFVCRVQPKRRSTAPERMSFGLLRHLQNLNSP